MPASVTRTYRIGEVAERAGVSPDTLRYYERAGLMAAPARTSGGFRLYAERDVQRLTFIRRAQAVGFSLDEIRGLLHHEQDRAEQCRRVRDLIVERLAQVDERLGDLRAFRRSLVQARECCERALQEDPTARRCPVVDDGVQRATHRRRADGLKRTHAR